LFFKPLAERFLVAFGRQDVKMSSGSRARVMSQFWLRPSSVIGMPIVAMKLRGMACSGAWKKPGCEKRGHTILRRAASPVDAEAHDRGRCRASPLRGAQNQRVTHRGGANRLRLPCVAGMNLPAINELHSVACSLLSCLPDAGLSSSGTNFRGLDETA
jgi:hypothetical protein